MKSQFSLTKDLQTKLLEPVGTIPIEPKPAELRYDSVRIYANQAGLPLEQWCRRDPQTAMMLAEGAVAAWENLLAEYALGKNETYKGQERLIQNRVDNARKDLDTVEKYCMEASEGLKKDALLDVLYKKALSGDTRSLMYVVDRIEGRIPEAIVEDYDYSSAPLVYEIALSLFDKQAEVMNCGWGTRIAKCSRRAGKTHLAAAMMLMFALRKPRTNCLIIGETMKFELGLIDSAMNEIIDRCELKDSKGNRLNWKRLENGSQIFVRGLSNTKDPDAIRGLKAKMICIDEFFHLKEELIQYLQLEVLGPMQADYGTEYVQLLIGTPPKRKGTYGSKVWDTWNVPKFKWTLFDNPHQADPDGFLDKECAEMGIDRTHPFIQREYLGMDVYESEWMLYPEFMSFNWEEEAPQMSIDLITCGVDYGTSASTALVCVAWDTVARRGFVWREAKFTMAECAEGVSILERLKQEVTDAWSMAFTFFPQMTKSEANKYIYWSADTNDKGSTQELAYNVSIGEEKLFLNIGDAHKTDKILMQDKLRDLLRTGALLLPENSKVALECELTVLKKDALGNILPEVDDKVYHPDLLPALRYAMWWAVGKEVRQ